MIKQVSQEVAVSEIFRNAVFGSNTTIIVGGGTIQNVSNSVLVNDMDSLLAALRKQGIAEGDLTTLQESILNDSESEEVKARQIGPRVKGWIAGMVKKAAEGAWSIGLGAAGAILSAAIAGYYGISGA